VCHKVNFKKESRISEQSYEDNVLWDILYNRHLDLKKPPTIQEEQAKDLLCHLDTHKSLGLDGIHPRVLREVAEELAKPLSIIYQQSCLIGKVPGDYEGLEGGSWELQACQPDLAAGEGYGAVHPE